MTRHVFNTNSYANTMILVDKFVAGLSSFGYDCYKIVGSHLNLENKECNSFLQMFIEWKLHAKGSLFGELFFMTERDWS